RRRRRHGRQRRAGGEPRRRRRGLRGRRGSRRRGAAAARPRRGPGRRRAARRPRAPVGAAPPPQGSGRPRGTRGRRPPGAGARALAETSEVAAGSYDAAVDLGYEAARVAAEAHDDGLVARALDHVAMALTYGRRRFDSAEVAYRSALTAAARAGNPPPLLAKMYGDRVLMLETRGEYQTALPLSLVAFALGGRGSGDDSGGAAEALMAVAGAMNHGGDPDEAGRLYGRALAIADKAVGPQPPITVAIVGDAGSNRLDVLDYDGAAGL